MVYFLSIDAGTTAIKVALFNTEGHLESLSRQEYKLETPNNIICELDPNIYWQAVIKGIKEVLSRSNVKTTEIKAVSISSQGETIIFVDKNGNPLRKAIVWLDNRSQKEADIIKKEFGARTIRTITGQPEIVPTWPATRILWLKRQQPNIFRKVYKYLLVEDYLLYRLTGHYYTEESMVSSSIVFDIRKKCWWFSMLKFLNISPGNLPEVLLSGKPIGQITEKVVKLTGLSKETIVVTGSYDHPAGAIGNGNIKSGMVSETTGASMAMCVTLDKQICKSSIKVPCQCHAIPNKYFLLPYGQTAGMVLKWFKDAFCQEEVSIASKKNKDVYDLMTEKAKCIPPGCEGLVMLPHLMGAGSPEFNPQAKGLFFGIGLNTEKAHFIRAIMEAVAYMLKRNIDLLEKMGIKIKEIRSIGGGAKSNLWNQIKADAIGLPIITLSSEESTSLGAAILAGVGCGIFKNIEEGCKNMVRIKKKFLPDNKKKSLYSKNYEKYITVYNRLTGK